MSGDPVARISEGAQSPPVAVSGQRSGATSALTEVARGGKVQAYG